MQLRYAALAALVLGLAVASNQVYAATSAPPTSGAATCASGFSPSPDNWNATGVTSYECKSAAPTCANGTVLKKDAWAANYVSYKCSVPGKSYGDDWEAPM